MTDQKTDIAAAELDALWIKHGGSFHGPHVETATMPKAKWIVFMRCLRKQLDEARLSYNNCADNADVLRDQRDEARRQLAALSQEPPASRAPDDDITPEKVRAIQAEADKDLAGQEWEQVSPASPSPVLRKQVWLIERSDLEPGRIHFCCEPGRNRHDWTTDANVARKFMSKAEADAIIGAATGLRATEHVFLAPASPSPVLRDAVVVPRDIVDFAGEMLSEASDRLGFDDMKAISRKLLALSRLATTGDRT